MLLMALASTAFAQFSVTLTGDPIRFTVPINSTGTYTATITVTVANGDGLLQTTLAPTGLPAGSGASLNTTVFTNSGTATLTFNYTNLTQGSYDVAIQASGDASYRLPIPVRAGVQWKNTASAGAFNSAANWVGGVVPGVNDTIIIPDVTFGNATTPSILVTSDTVIGGVRDIHNGNSTFPNINIAAGATLSVTGTNGYRQLRDTLTSNSRAYFQASGAGTLLVSNAVANFDLMAYAENTQNYFLFDALNTLKLDVNRITIDDIAAYPNYRTNGTSTYPRRWSPRFYLAKTNIFRATQTDANSWNNAARDYSFVIDRHRAGNGSGTRFGMRFGLQNEFYCDSMLWCGSGSSCDQNSANNRIDFNTGLTGTRVLIIRGPNGGRMSNFTLADAAVADGGTVSQGTKLYADLTDGSVDALVDKFYIGRDADTTSGGQATGTLIIGSGTLDVNDASLGYQTGPGNGTGVGYCGGRLDVNGTALFRVNGTLVLGHTTVAALTPFAAESGYGQVNIGGGTVQVNNVTVGGVTAASINNNISLTAGGTLVVSNDLASASARLNSLSMSDSTLVLYANPTAARVFVKTLVNGGAGNVINLAGVTGVSSYPATLPLISYTGSAAPNFSLVLPSGLYGFLVNNTANSTIDAIITTNPPASLTWNGNVNGNWDTSTANWQGGLVFANGDQATFDDSASGSAAVTVVGTVLPGTGGVLVNNTNKNYSFSGGTIGGTALLTKQGPGSLTMNASSALALNLNQGTVTGSGAIGATTVASGATLAYTGTINGLATAGTSSSSGTMSIGLSVTGGTFDNAGTINGTYSISGGAATNRAGSVVNTVGVSSTSTGATLVHNGHMFLGNANVNSRFASAGNLTGSGIISDVTGDTAGNNGRVEINPGGVFTPGGSNVIGSFTIEGRFDLNTGASPDGTMIIDVDLNNPLKNDVVKVDKWSNLRGALVMNNIGSVPFAAGQSFQIVTNNFGLANTPETAFDLANKITPKAPGVGLQWDLANLRTNGIIAVVAAPLTPPGLTNTIVGGTNLTLNWPTTHLGYQLQVQTNTLAVGLTTNWHPIVGSENATSYSVLINPTNPAVFYRLSNQ